MRIRRLFTILSLACALAMLPVASSAFAQEYGDDDEEDLEPPPEVETETEKTPDAEPEQGKMETPPPVAPSGNVLDGPGPGPTPPPPPGARPRVRLLPGLQKPSSQYDPHVGFQWLLFFSGHPTDRYTGLNLSAHFHFTQKISASLDGRIGGGADRDDDLYAHSMASFGASGYYWFRGEKENCRLQPYARVGYGFFYLGDETYQDPDDSDIDNHDWDKSSRNYKVNGTPADGYSSSYIEEAAGVRFMLWPSLWYLSLGGTLDLELALVQDTHYGFSDSSLKFSLGMTLYF